MTNETNSRLQIISIITIATLCLVGFVYWIITNSYNFFGGMVVTAFCIILSLGALRIIEISNDTCDKKIEEQETVEAEIIEEPVEDRFEILDIEKIE